MCNTTYRKHDYYTICSNTSGVARGGAMGAGCHGRQNRTFGVNEMVRMKVLKGEENFWLRRKIFRAERISQKKVVEKNWEEQTKNVGRGDEEGRQI